MRLKGDPGHNMSYISIRNAAKKFGGHTVLKNICMEVEKGQLVTLLGPSGCGKSTLLRCIAGLEELTSGKVILDGKDITDTEASERGIGMVFQDYSLFPNMDVSANMAFGLKMKKIPKNEIAKRVEQMAGLVGLKDYLHYYPSELSGGQQQRAALGRALVTEPKVMLMDEPLSAVDASMKRELQEEIRDISRKLNMTVIFVTHDQDEAMVMSDVIFLMHDGEIEQSAPPREMYMNPSTRFAASFIGHRNIIPGDVFRELTGEDTGGREAALRPELIEISSEPVRKEGFLTVRGRIAGSLSHGNIIRYTVMCGNTRIDAETLFRESDVIPDNTDVYLSFRKEDCSFV